MSALFKFVRTTIVGGVLFLVPVVLLIVLMEKAIAIAERVVEPIAKHFPDSPVLGVASVTLIGALLLLVLSFCAGLIAKTRLGRGCVAWIEKVLLSKMPGYVLVRNMVGDLVSSLDSLGREQQQRSVLVRFDDTWQLGIVVDQFASGLLSVFVPGAPSPLSGSLCFVEPDRVRPSGLSVHETTELLKRLGVGSARELAAQF